MFMNFPFWNSITWGVIVKYDATRQLHMIKTNTRNFTLEYSHNLNEFKSHYRMTKAIGISNITEIRRTNSVYIHVLMKISIIIISGFTIPLKT